MIGFDIGGTKCSVCFGKETHQDIEIIEKKTIETDLNISAYEMIDRMVEISKSFLDDTNIVGISCGGPLDSKKGIIMSPPNLTGWNNIEIVAYLKEKYSINAFLENDANACALAEWKFGAGKDAENMIFLTFGTGLGAGMILNNQLYRGANDMAGEAGHIRLREFGPVGYGKMGSFEGFCSGGGIKQLAQSYITEKLQMGKTVAFCENMTQLNSITAKTIGEYAKKGDSDAIEIYNKCGEMLGYGLSILIDILNPEKIVLGSIFQRCEEFLRPAMEKVLKKECLHFSLDVCKIVPAKLCDNIGDYAALAVALTNSDKKEIL